MADKPKLKETDEILSSIGKKTKAPAILSTDVPQGDEGPISPVLDAPRGRRRRPATPPDGEEKTDNNPLDIGKYDLKKPAGRQKAAGAGSRIVRPIEQQESAVAEPLEQPVQKYQFADLSPEHPAPDPQQSAEAGAEAPKPAPKKRGRPRKAESAKSEKAAMAVEMQLQGDVQPQAEQPPKRGRGRPRKNPLPELQPVQEEQKAPEPQYANEPESLLPPPRDPQQVREDFRRMLADQFNEAFTQRFEGEGEGKKSKKDDPIDDSWFEEKPRKNQREALLPPEEELALKRETEQFIQEFEQKVKEEESSKQESFQETLAQKFMRERERYLKELGVLEDEETQDEDAAIEQPQAAPAQSRKLDLQIQPEMHSGEGVARGPVTYGPGGNTRPMENEEDNSEPLPYLLPVGERAAAKGYHKPAPGTPGAAQAAYDKIHTPAQAPSGKKSPEELLMELGVQNAVRGQQPLAPPRQLTPEERKRQADLLHKQSLLSFALKGGKALPPTGKQKLLGKKIAAIAACLVLVLVVALGPIAKVMGLWDKQGNLIDELPGITLGDNTITVYESNNPDELTEVGDILVKRGGISLSNYKVGNHVVIGDIETQSDILLRDMTVGGNIYVQSCGVNQLRLQNVTADRIVVNNSLQRVEVIIEGDTDVNILEVRTPTSVFQQELGEEAGGLVSVQAKQESMGVLDIGINNVSLNSVSTSGSTIVTLGGESVVVNMSSEGTLNLAGDGRVSSLSASGMDGEELSLSIKDVQVMSLSIDGPAQAALAGQVDVLTVVDSVMLSGNGNINMLWAKRGMDDRRITVDLVGTQVSTLIADTEVLVNSDGDNRIGAMTANESTYTLGNPVGQLTVNHDRVIYENEPDKVVVKNGVRPPESVMDNPNVDFTLSTRQSSGLADASGDSVGTTCNHTRENGGFVYGDGSRTDPFQVATPAQLAHVAEHLDSHYVQTADIDLSEDSQFASGFTPIGLGDTPFQGTYDGGGYQISGLRINESGEQVGLFAQNVGTVKNVHITGGEIRSTSAASAHVGGVVAFNFSGGVVEACSNGARIIGAAGGNTGGVVGYNFGAKIRDCYNYAKISGGGSVGGVVGANRQSGSVVGSYNAGTVEDATSAGSVVGENTDATIVNCYYLADTAEYGVGSGNGSTEQRSHAQMIRAQFARDLAAGDEDTLWRMPTIGSYSYPVLGKPEEAGLVYSQTTPDDDDEEEIPIDDVPTEVYEDVG